MKGGDVTVVSETKEAPPTRVSELYFEELGEDFERFMSPYDAARRRALIDELLPGGEPGACLEVGCGTGEISRMLADRTTELTVCDISEKLARTVAGRIGCKGRREDACRLTLGDAGFDLVVSSECIEHTPDPLAALGEMVRVLRPGGHLVVTTPNKLWYPLLILARTLGVRRFRGNEIWISPRTARRWSREQGLCLEAISGCHLFPWQVPFSKRVLPWFDRMGPWLHPLMVNFGFRVRKGCADCAD